MYLPSVTRYVEPLKLNLASDNPKRARRVLIIILGRKAERYNLGFLLEQRVEPVRKLSFERRVFGLKGREAITYLRFVDVLSPINEIGRGKFDVRKKSNDSRRRLVSQTSLASSARRFAFPSQS
jgi:hypothetical protein